MSAITDLVFHFFSLCDLKPIEIRKGIYQVQVGDSLAKELDGFRAKGGLFQFTFDKKLAEHFGAELIHPGSYRLDSIIKVIQKQAVVSTGTLPHHVFYEPSIRRKLLEKLAHTRPGYRFYVLDHQQKFGPYFWFILRVTFLAYEKREELHNPLIDLVSGHVVGHEIPADMIEANAPSPESVYRRKLSFKQAYTRIQAELTHQLQYSNPTWAKEAHQQLSEEKQQLEDYFQESTESNERNQRLQELMARAKPRVQVRPLRGALLYVPKFSYKLMQVGSTETVRTILYDPVSNQIEEQG